MLLVYCYTWQWNCRVWRAYSNASDVFLLYSSHFLSVNRPQNVDSWYVEIKYQLDATEVFIVDLISCSTCFGHHYAHHPELKSIIQWLLPVVFRAVKM